MLLAKQKFYHYNHLFLIFKAPDADSDINLHFVAFVTVGNNSCVFNVLKSFQITFYTNSMEE